MSYLKKKKTISKLTIVVGLSLAAVLHIIFLRTIDDDIFKFLSASDNVLFNQKIVPYNPVKEVSSLESVSYDNPDFSSSRYRIITSLTPETGIENPVVTQKKEVPSVISFSGESLFPNSKILLEINSKKFFASTESDSQGHWTWTNYGHPLEEGEHSIEMYNISPYEISGKRDVYADKFLFKVANAADDGSLKTVELEPQGYVEKDGDGDAGDFLKNGEASGLYLFSLNISDKRSYFAGEDLDLQMVFSCLGNGDHPANIEYEIFEYPGGSHSGQKIMEFNDSVMVSGENSFLKKITLKDRMKGGEYLLKATVEVSGRTYVQSLVFEVSDKEVVRIGSNSITREELENVLVWNILVILVSIIVFLTMIIFEYKRSIWKKPVSEDSLRGKGYF